MENSRREYEREAVEREAVEREAVPHKRRENMFYLYGEKQIQYNSIQNEYNICNL